MAFGSMRQNGLRCSVRFGPIATAAVMILAIIRVARSAPSELAVAIAVMVAVAVSLLLMYP